MVAGAGAFEETGHGRCPEFAKVRDEGLALYFPIPDVDLNAARISDAAMQESNPLENRLQEFELVLEAAVDEFLTCVPMREVAVEP